MKKARSPKRPAFKMISKTPFSIWAHPSIEPNNISLTDPLIIKFSLSI